MSKQTITVLGAGYVGLTTATLLANSGFKVFVVEPANAKRLEIIKEGRSFFYEEGLDSLISKVIKNKNLVATDSYEESVPESDVVFSCVGTPDKPDGSSNLSYVFSAAEDCIRLAQKDIIYIQKSTVPVGTGADIKSLIEKSNKNISYVSNPEFLREGTALFDTLFFDRIVVGGNNEKALDIVISLYRAVESHRMEIAKLAGVKTGIMDGQYIKTSLNSAELIKVTANAFLALKISFANSIAKISDKVGADIKEVMDAVGADPRIGRSFLNAGRGYGGGCFPKDVSGLISSADNHGVDLIIMKSAQKLNLSMPEYIIDKLKRSVKDFSEIKVAVLGLAFKAGTSDVRKSPGIVIANRLSKLCKEVKVYDPKVSKNDKLSELSMKIVIKDSLLDAISGVDAILIATDWSEFTELDVLSYAKLSNMGCVFVDAMNCFDPKKVKSTGMNYIGVGIN